MPLLVKLTQPHSFSAKKIKTIPDSANHARNAVSVRIANLSTGQKMSGAEVKVPDRCGKLGCSKAISRHQRRHVK